MNVGVVVAGDVAALRAYARERGWRHVRLLSAGESTLKRDLGTEREDGAQDPTISVFTKSTDGCVNHFYTGGALMGEGQFRGMDLLSPVWNFLDLTPGGRGDGLPKVEYED